AFQGYPTGSIQLAHFLVQGSDNTATIDWGDGSASEIVPAADITSAGSTATILGNHTFPLGGTFTVTVTLTDSAGDSATATNTVTVAADVSSQVRLVGLGGPINPQTNLLTSSGTLTNMSGTDIAGPLYLIVHGLPAGVTLTDADGQTVNGLPYR